MKFLPAQFAYLLSQREMRRNLKSLGKFLVILVVLIFAFAELFHLIMGHVEHQDHSWVTGLYWTLTVMTTLGLSIARDEELDIVTDSGEYHEALLASDEEIIIDALLSDAKSLTAGVLDRQQALGELVFALSGINLKAIRPEHIPDLQSTPGFHDFQDALRRAALDR